MSYATLRDHVAQSGSLSHYISSQAVSAARPIALVRHIEGARFVLKQLDALRRWKARQETIQVREVRVRSAPHGRTATQDLLHCGPERIAASRKSGVPRFAVRERSSSPVQIGRLFGTAAEALDTAPLGRLLRDHLPGSARA